MTMINQDVRIAVRALRRSPGFTLAAVAALAIGNGLNSASVSVVRGALIRPVPYVEADGLVLIRESLPQLADMFPSLPVNGRHFLEWQQQTASFEQLAAVRPVDMDIAGEPFSERVGGAAVSPALFDVLGVRAEIGRLFTDAEISTRPRAAVITYSLWQRRFGANPAVVSSALWLNGERHEIVGVLPASFYFPKSSELGAFVSLPTRTDVFVPLHLRAADLRPAGNHNYAVVGRLKDGVSIVQAHHEMDAVQSRVAALDPELTGLRAVLVPLVDQVSGSARSALIVLQAAALTIFLLICANIVIMFLARANRRREETAVRKALGASRWQIVRLSLTEASLVSLAGAALGLGVAKLTTAFFAKTTSTLLPGSGNIQPDGPVIFITMGVAVFLAVVFGGLPTLVLAGRESAVQVTSRGGSAGRGEVTARRYMVAAQVALTAVLLVVVGGLLQTFNRLLQVDLGFNQTNAVTIDVALPPYRFTNHQQRFEYYSRVVRELGRLPDVVSAGVTSLLPLEGEGGVDVLAADRTELGRGTEPIANYRYVDAGYFKSMGIQVLAGRGFGAGDYSAVVAGKSECSMCGAASNVIVLSHAAAQMLWPGQDPIGKFAIAGNVKEPVQVVGIVSDVPSNIEGSPPSVAYLPNSVQSPHNATLVVRGATDVPSLLEVKAAVTAVDAGVPITRLEDLQSRVQRSFLTRRNQLNVALLFGTVALLISGMGIYAVASSSAVRRHREVGIRLAVGGSPSAVARHLVREQMLPVLSGLAVGMLGAAYVGRLLNTAILNGAGLTVPAIVGAISALLLVAFIASMLPIRRATMVEPSIRLREN